MKVARNIGLIRILVHRITVTKSHKEDKNYKTPHNDQSFATDGIILAEKALKGKALSHATK